MKRIILFLFCFSLPTIAFVHELEVNLYHVHVQFVFGKNILSQLEENVWMMSKSNNGELNVFLIQVVDNGVGIIYEATLDKIQQNSINFLFYRQVVIEELELLMDDSYGMAIMIFSFDNKRIIGDYIMLPVTLFFYNKEFILLDY